MCVEGLTLINVCVKGFYFHLFHDNLSSPDQKRNDSCWPHIKVVILNPLMSFKASLLISHFKKSTSKYTKVCWYNRGASTPLKLFMCSKVYLFFLWRLEIQKNYHNRINRTNRKKQFTNTFRPLTKNELQKKKEITHGVNWLAGGTKVKQLLAETLKKIHERLKKRKSYQFFQNRQESKTKCWICTNTPGTRPVYNW